MSYRPTGKNVLIERIAAQKQTSSGIILQRTEGPEFAKVLAIGPDVKEVAVDDVVLLDWNKAVKVEDDTYCVPITEVIFVYGE